ncbi:uncharacterized protein LOC129690130 [Psammomys obesus]|uniref:uncharacterized protein LOC129690130 n=1 Tax=Psammomys obesus TaxID=48139 RepID=UPI0024528E6E|nr:uncharacterized protein LOC129690130 [Psammomys obesus]
MEAGLPPSSKSGLERLRCQCLSQTSSRDRSPQGARVPAPPAASEAALQAAGSPPAPPGRKHHVWADGGEGNSFNPRSRPSGGRPSAAGEARPSAAAAHGRHTVAVRRAVFPALSWLAPLNCLRVKGRTGELLRKTCPEDRPPQGAGFPLAEIRGSLFPASPLNSGLMLETGLRCKGDHSSCFAEDVQLRAVASPAWSLAFGAPALPSLRLLW